MFYDITRFLVVGELRFVDWNWGSLVDRGWGVDWSSLHNNRSRLVDWGWGWFIDWSRGWGIDWGWLVDWSSLNHDWSSLVDRGGLDNNRGWGIGDRGWLVSWGCVISSLSRVGDISDVSTVTISDIVGHSLCASIRQGNTVASLGTVSISRLVSIVVGSTVVIIDSVCVAVDSRFIVVGLSIGWSSVTWSHNSSMGSDGTGEDDDGLKWLEMKYFFKLLMK